MRGWDLLSCSCCRVVQPNTTLPACVSPHLSCFEMSLPLLFPAHCLGFFLLAHAVFIVLYLSIYALCLSHTHTHTDTNIYVWIHIYTYEDMYMHVYIYMWHVCLWYIYTCTYVQMCLLTHIHIRMCICVCVRVCVCIYICLFTRTHPPACDAQTHTYTCDSVRARVCVFVRRCESMCVRRVEYGCEKSRLGVYVCWRLHWVSVTKEIKKEEGGWHESGRVRRQVDEREDISRWEWGYK